MTPARLSRLFARLLRLLPSERRYLPALLVALAVTCAAFAFYRGYVVPKETRPTDQVGKAGQ